MNFKTFAADHKFRTTSDDGGEVIIAGRQGQIYEYDSERLGVMFMPPKTETEPFGRWCPKLWGNFRRAGVAAGMDVLQNGDSEGCLIFDPTNKGQVKLAIKIAGVRPKRKMKPEQVAKMVARLALYRQNPPQGRVLSV